MSHTPDPWEVIRHGEEYLVVGAGCDIEEIGSGRQQPIALLFRYSAEDARLIASAPRMFNALSAALCDLTTRGELSEATVNMIADALTEAHGKNLEVKA